MRCRKLVSRSFTAPREAMADNFNRMQGIHRQTAIAYKRSNPPNRSLQPYGPVLQTFSIRQALGMSPCEFVVRKTCIPLATAANIWLDGRSIGESGCHSYRFRTIQGILLSGGEAEKCSSLCQRTPCETIPANCRSSWPPSRLRLSGGLKHASTARISVSCVSMSPCGVAIIVHC